MFIAIKPWRLFELDVLDHRNTTWYLTDPMIHYAFRKPSDEWLESSMRAEDYHIDFHAGVRVAQFGYLRPVDAVETTVDEDGDVEEFQRHLWVDADVIEARRREKIKASVGVFVVLNSKTIRGAKQYIENDPLMKNSLLTDSVSQSVAPPVVPHQLYIYAGVVACQLARRVRITSPHGEVVQSARTA